MAVSCAGNQTLPEGIIPDDTAYIQALLDSDDQVIVIPRGDRPWQVRPLRITAHDKQLVFENGCVIEARPGDFIPGGDCLLTLDSCENVRITGYGARLSMRKDDYARSPYVKGEWRHCVSLYSCSSVALEGLEISNSGGDGVYVGQRKDALPCVELTLRDLYIHDNRRQGVSVISAHGFLMEGCVVKGTKGTPPSAGIDFEPNTGTSGFSDCTVRDCRFEGNAGPGVLVYPLKLAGTGAPVEIRFERCVSTGSFFSVSLYGIPKGLAGSIDFYDCTLRSFKWVQRSRSLKVTFHD